mmetsp:Transcript_101307/g.285669  ORF Transcript_101307/g.285669 Transcript_101307/m.285669 type:complete len:208 (-) Transcript_101307:384-1007(-)
MIAPCRHQQREVAVPLVHIARVFLSSLEQQLHDLGVAALSSHQQREVLVRLVRKCDVRAVLDQRCDSRLVPLFGRGHNRTATHHVASGRRKPVHTCSPLQQKLHDVHVTLHDGRKQRSGSSLRHQGLPRRGLLRSWWCHEWHFWLSLRLVGMRPSVEQQGNDLQVSMGGGNDQGGLPVQPVHLIRVGFRPEQGLHDRDVAPEGRVDE